MSTEIKQNTPLVSVIMPAYNAEPFIREAIASVQAQSLSDWELLVIDDGSQDTTRSVVTGYTESDQRIQLIVNPENLGVAKTRNRGMDLFRGQYVAFLDSDDYWEPQMLEKMVAKAIETHADIIYCSYHIVDENSKKICNDFIVPEQTSFKESIVRSVILCSMVLMTKAFAQNHRFPVKMYHEDIALWFEALRNGYTACGVPEILAAYRQSTNTKTANKLKSAYRRWPIYRKHLHMSFAESVVAMVRYAYYGVLKYKRV